MSHCIKPGIPVRCTCCGSIVGHINDSSEYVAGLLCISCSTDLKKNNMTEPELEQLKEWEQ